MNNLTLMILAAGMGSRFGGLKQLTPVGQHGESILDYSVHDAIEAGFDRVVFIIKHAIEEEFYEKVGRKIEAHVKVDYVFQEIDDMPNSLTPPEGRTKPWGTGHAVWCALKQTEADSFAVINADDYYGKEAFRTLADFLRNPPHTDGIPMAMAGYRLKNTLSDNGYVSRGVCVVDETSKLVSITERTRIERRNGTPAFSEDGGERWTPLAEDTFVSMNCWAFPAEVKPVFHDMMNDFFKENASELKKEFYLPLIPDHLVQSGQGQVFVLPTEDKWYGMTYAEDKQEVIDALASLTAKGYYPKPLWP
ncbi:MAG: nucleotidyltransferase [Ruminococcaceae bacterium]|nr:nucleotidyltransferase [Oscillospiraceae bacterium]